MGLKHTFSVSFGSAGPVNFVASIFVEVGRARMLQNFGRLDLANRLAFHPVWPGVAGLTSPTIRNIDRNLAGFAGSQPWMVGWASLLADVDLLTSGTGQRGGHTPSQASWHVSVKPKVKIIKLPPPMGAFNGASTS